jgi:hypothetical protein
MSNNNATSTATRMLNHSAEIKVLYYFLGAVAAVVGIGGAVFGAVIKWKRYRLSKKERGAISAGTELGKHLPMPIVLEQD